MVALRCLLVAAGLALAGCCFWYYFLLRTSPPAPNSETGQTVLMMEHGTSFYIRQLEHDIHFALMWGGLIVLVGLYLFDLYDSRRRLRALSPLPEALAVPLYHDQLAGRGILTFRIILFLMLLLVLCMPVVGSGGRIPFHWLL